jgi:hypothetical protein
VQHAYVRVSAFSIDISGNGTSQEETTVVGVKTFILCCLEIILVVTLCQANRVPITFAMVRLVETDNIIPQFRRNKLIALIIYHRVINGKFPIQMIFPNEILQRGENLDTSNNEKRT